MPRHRCYPLCLQFGSMCLCFLVLRNLYQPLSNQVTDPWEYDDIHFRYEPLVESRHHADSHNPQRKLSQLPRNISIQDPTILNWYNLSKPVLEDFQCTLTRTEPIFQICTYEPERDKYVSAALLSDGVWEPYITPLVSKALDFYPNTMFVDIGANLGYYSLLAAMMGHDVISVEPNYDSVLRLHRAAQLNRVTDKIRVFLNAISDRHEAVTLTQSKDNQGGVWIEPLGQTKPRHRVSELQRKLGAHTDVLQTTTLNHLLYVSEFSQAVIKIDIEGSECRAMAQSQRLLSTVYVPYIFMEWRRMYVGRDVRNTPCPRSYINKLSRMLVERGYNPYEVRTGFELDPDRSATAWQIGDVYWKHSTAAELQEPY